MLYVHHYALPDSSLDLRLKNPHAARAAHLPGMVNTGALPKKSANFLESSVAEVTMRRKSARLATTLRRMPNSTSAGVGGA